MMKALVRYLLKNRMKFQDDWTMQGFGFLRLRISETVRMHVWDARLRSPGVSDVHDHTQWAFTSHVISGSLVNVRYQVCDPTSPPLESAMPYTQATLKCGIGGGMLDGSSKAVWLLADRPELYLPGQSYRQEPDEIHRSVPADGTVTLIEQTRREVDTARVFWPRGGSWGDAIPRAATRDEVEEVGGFALSIFPE
jgi:hypothetical protein